MLVDQIYKEDMDSKQKIKAFIAMEDQHRDPIQKANIRKCIDNEKKSFNQKVSELMKLYEQNLKKMEGYMKPISDQDKDAPQPTLAHPRMSNIEENIEYEVDLAKKGENRISIPKAGQVTINVVDRTNRGSQDEKINSIEREFYEKLTRSQIADMKLRNATVVPDILKEA